jgi:hypothetical protein
MSTSIAIDEDKNDSKRPAINWTALQGKYIQEEVAKWMEENMVFYKTNMVENVVDIVVSRVEGENAPQNGGSGVVLTELCFDFILEVLHS